MRGGGQNKFRGHFWKMPVKLFPANSSLGSLLCVLSWLGRDVVGPKVFVKSLPRLETLQSTPPFFQLYFLLRLILGENWL